MAAGEGVPSTPAPAAPKLSSTAKTSGGTPAADPAPSDAFSHSVQTPKARVVPPRSRTPRTPASSPRSPDRAGPVTRSNIEGVAKAVSSLPSVARGAAAAVLRVAAPVAASEPPTSGTSPSAEVSQPATTPASLAPPGEPPTGTPSPTGPDQETEMLEREHEAETISTSWPSPMSAEEPAAAELAQDLQNFIGQYQSLVRDRRPASQGDSRSASPHAATAETAPPAVQEEVTLTLTGTPLPSPDRNTAGGVPAAPSAENWGAISRAISESSAVASGLDPLADMRRVLHRTPLRSVQSGTNLTVSTSLPSGAGSALGSSGGSGVPSAAVLVLAIACLLATRLLGRRTTDPPLWWSAVLNLRLERPG